MADFAQHKKLRREARNKTLAYVTGGLGFVAGLAWNDAIAAFIEVVFPQASNTLLAKFAYAIMLTVVVVVVATYLTRVFSEKEKSG